MTDLRLKRISPGEYEVTWKGVHYSISKDTDGRGSWRLSWGDGSDAGETLWECKQMILNSVEQS